MRLQRETLINLNLLFLAIIGGAVVLVIAWRVLQVLLPVLILLLAAMLLAFLLGPLVASLQSAGLPRGLAVLLVYAMLLGCIFGFGSLLLAPLAQQIGGLAGSLPKNVNHMRHLVRDADAWMAARNVPIHLEQLQTQGLTYAQHLGQDVLGSTLDIVQTISRVVIDILAIIVISLYLLVDGARIRYNILRVIPDGQRSQVLFLDAAVRSVIGGYVRGQLILALTIGLMASAGCFVLHVHYPLVIGLLAGFFELIPMLGPILGALPAIGIAAFQTWQLAIATVVLFILIQQLEAHVIAPRVMGHAVGVHPIIAILAVLLGAQLGGVLGALIAVPVAGIAYVIAQVTYANIFDQHHDVTVVRRAPLVVRVFRSLRDGVAARPGGLAEDTVTITVDAPTDQLASIVHDRDLLAQEFALAEQREAEETPESPQVPVGLDDG